MSTSPTPQSVSEYVVPPSLTVEGHELEHNDLDQLKRQAKDLLKALQPEAAASAGIPASAPGSPALELARRHYHGALPSPLQLADAQLIIARHHGFESWGKLRAKVDQVNLGKLLAAIERGDVKLATELVRKRPELVQMDTAGNNEHRALHYAVIRRHAALVRVLMKAGADAHKGIYPHRDATTPMALARDRGYVEIVEAIEEEEQFRREDMSCPNATVSPEQDEIARAIREKRGADAIAMLRDAPSLIHACDREGGTALHIACQEGALDVIDWLLEHRANPRKADLNDRTPLERAIYFPWKQRGRTKSLPAVAQRLIRHGAPMTPMLCAAMGDTAAILELHRRDPATGSGATKTDGWARPQLWQAGPGLLGMAVTFGQVEMLRLLLRLGLHPDQQQRVGNMEAEVFSHGTPLWLAAAYSEYEMALALIEAGADTNAYVYASGTPLDRAYGAYDPKMVALLNAHGAKAGPATIGSYRDVPAAEAYITANPPPSVDDLEQVLWGAACGGSPEIVSMCLPLMPWGPDDPHWHTMLVQPLRIFQHSPLFDDHSYYDRNTYPECLRLILAHGVNLNLAGRFGDTLMHNIAALGKTWGVDVMTTAERLAFARATLEESASRQARGGARSPFTDGVRTPGREREYSPDKDLLNLSARDELLKSTPLGWACRWGHPALVQLLLEYGASAEEPDAKPWAQPLAWARRMGHMEIVGILEARIQSR